MYFHAPRFDARIDGKVKEEGGRVFVDLASVTRRHRAPHPRHPFARPIVRVAGPVRVAIVHWADAVLIATPIRWGVASSLYFKMAERLNCVQNQVTLRNRVMLRNKVAAFIITGGQDNVQAVAGQALQFFSELGCQYPQFPYIAHSRGWSAEDMENNVAFVQRSAELHEAARALVDRTIDLARCLMAGAPAEHDARAGRKASGILTAVAAAPTTVAADDEPGPV